MPDSIDERLRGGQQAAVQAVERYGECCGGPDDWVLYDVNPAAIATAAITAYLSASGLLTTLSSLGEVERAARAAVRVSGWGELDYDEDTLLERLGAMWTLAGALAALDHPLSPGDAE